jgi:methylated-DNA-protein-cysteine methyltransferase related protein
MSTYTLKTTATRRTGHGLLDAGGATADDRRVAESAEVIQARARRVPPGFVTTYADLCPGAPRQAGRALSLHGDDIPWWRVVRSDGTWAKGEEQRRRLERERIPIRGNRVALAEARIDPEAIY